MDEGNSSHVIPKELPATHLSPSPRCVTSGLTLKIDERKGRCLHATRPFGIGETVIANIPLSSVLIDSFIEARCSHCFSKSQRLQRCASCRYVHYCDTKCQREAWIAHKYECKSILSLKNRLQGQDQEIINCRFILMLQGLKQMKPSEEDCFFDNTNNYSRCNITHAIQMASHSTPSIKENTSVISTLIPRIGTTDIEFWLERFHCNNFGITDELLHCVGAGVFPYVALINHSCLPNCVLRYKITKHMLPSVEVREI